MNNVQGIIDIHTHILPGVDDGAADWDEARWMLRCAYEQGIRTIIATPHYSHRQDVGRLRELAGQLDEEAKIIAEDFRIFLGQEILYFDSIVERLQEGHALTMAGSRYVLVEFMPDVTYPRIFQVIRKMLLARYIPVLAHMERYRCLRTDGRIEELIRSGCLIQMNFTSIQGSRFQSNVRWCRKQLLEQRVHFLGTDMHDSVRRKPDIMGVLEWMKGHMSQNAYNQLLRYNPACILKNKILE